MLVLGLSMPSGSLMCLHKLRLAWTMTIPSFSINASGIVGSSEPGFTRTYAPAPLETLSPSSLSNCTLTLLGVRYPMVSKVSSPITTSPFSRGHKFISNVFSTGKTITDTFVSAPALTSTVHSLLLSFFTITLTLTLNYHNSLTP